MEITIRNMELLEIALSMSVEDEVISVSRMAIKTGMTYSHAHTTCKYFDSIGLLKMHEKKGRVRQVKLTKKGERTAIAVRELLTALRS